MLGLNWNGMDVSMVGLILTVQSLGVVLIAALMSLKSLPHTVRTVLSVGLCLEGVKTGFLLVVMLMALNSGL